MSAKRQNHEDQSFARLFDGTMNNVPLEQSQAEEVKPDAEFLARLRETSTEVFVQHAQSATSPPKRRNKMIVLAMRALTTAAAVVAVAFGVMWSSKPSLTDDGRIGKVADRQGIVSVKPLNHDRWSPVVDRLVLQPGDWLRTDVRGANAVKIRLVPQTDITLGPGAMVELMAAGKIRLLAGEIKVVAEQKSPLELIGPDDQKRSIGDTQLLRVDGKKIVPVEKTPLWLKGFEGATNNESIGSLIAKVDGRNVPLTVGYHKVTVDIRDQIARTTIEESFVNHTDGRLEGVFYFPLPQDASISGFGMWIGDELVEADVVEKQRAREIYETILRERRDPGMLEWTGGNIFKARVFPIFGHSEKRIKITYTQVLPRRGNRYRYSYALQSELLKQNPLRELSIDVKINSAVSLSKVTSPTHAARISRTDRSAGVEFSAQEYTPTSDFEVVVETDGRQSDVVMIPHRRGDDGYFMLQLTPPSDSGQWQRDVLADGEPVNVLILADTSASMDEGARRRQAELVAALLGSLTEKDSFNLATCDVETRWAFDEDGKPNDKSIAAARDFLDRGVALGWTDLDEAFKSALAKSAANTHIVYIGDGIVTARDTDPVRFANRLRRLYEGKKGTCHAVATSSSFEPLVLKTIASLGGGSQRFISGQKGPQAVALELLGEITQPGVRDLKVEFTGLRTARVYPGRLPNLAAGSQQILLGRYLPEGAEQKGQVVVTGRRGEEKIRMKSDVSLKDAESGNSFIPRLWARMHLDELLEQGSTQTIKDEIIALSEEYHIMTPYTSLLVLESDADRERFKVKRRFQMRDGEKFFAAGRENADYELVQQQMRRAGGWRLDLRAAVLRDLAGLGRVDNLFGQQEQAGRGDFAFTGFTRGRVAGPTSESGQMWFAPSGMSGNMRYDRGYRGQKKDESKMPMELGWEFASSEIQLGESEYNMPLEIGGKATERQLGESEVLSDRKSSRDWADFDTDGLDLAKKLGSVEKFPERSEPIAADRLFDREELPMIESELKKDPSAFMAGDKLEAIDGPVMLGQRLSKLSLAPASAPVPSDSYFFARYSGRNRGAWTGKPAQPRPAQWFGALFPYLPPIPSDKEADEPKSTWPADASRLAKSLLRTEQLAKIDGGASIDVAKEYFDTLHKIKTSRSENHALVSPGAWLVRSGGGAAQTLVNWCNKTERGVLSKAFLLGRVRKSTPKELQKPLLGLGGYVLRSLDMSYRNHKVEVKAQGDDGKILTLKHLNNPEIEVRVTIDTKRQVITKFENLHHGRVTSTETYGDFVRWGGAWWAGSIERTDDKGRRVSLVTQSFKALRADQFTKKMKGELANRSQTQLIKEPLVSVKEAKQQMADGKATFDDQLAMLLHFSATQQWERALKHLEAAEVLAKGKPGMRYVRTAVLNTARRREEVKNRYLEDARALAKAKQSDALFLADYMRGQAGRILQENEKLELLDRLRAVYERQPPLLLAMKRLLTARADHLQRVHRVEEEMKLRKQLATDYPSDAGLQQRYAQRLVETGEQEAAWDWFNASLAKGRKWHEHERESLRNAQAQFLRDQGRYEELTKYLGAWIEENPKTGNAYPQYLTALIRTGREKEAWRLMDKWFEDARRPQAQEHGRLKPADMARLNAAISQALGQGYNLHTNRLDDRWYNPLEKTALFFADHKQHSADIANRIMGNHHFSRSDACRRVRAKAVVMLVNKFDTLSDAQVRLLVDWIMPNDPAVETETWKKIAAKAMKRYGSLSDPDVRHRFGDTVLRILSKVSADEQLEFMRLRYRKGPDKYRTEYARALFNTLLSRPFKKKHEDEAFGFLDKMVDSKDRGVRLASQIGGLQRLTNSMVKARYEARMKKVEHPEKLTRTELRDKKTEALRLAREAYAKGLKQRARKLSRPLGDWFIIERLYIETKAKGDRERIADECWELLDAKPKKHGGEADRMQVLQEMLQHRVLTTLSNLAARKKAKPELVERLLKYLDAGIAADIGNPYWKQGKYRMLIALDRPEELEAVLRSWIEPGKADNHWRRSLAFLLAEQGKLAEAIGMLEAVEKSDELSSADYRTMSGWYMAEGHRKQYRRALVASYKATGESQLRNWLRGRLRLWQRGDSNVPGEMHKDVPLVFTAIFEKSGNPSGHLHQLREFYKSTHDFRLLAGLAESVVGHTAGKVYPFLQNAAGVLAEVRDEATADSIVEHLEKTVRPRAKTEVDRRALDLLELLVERRGAELVNQPGPHSQKALSAMRRAFKREWSQGEPRLMADFLAALGQISTSELAAEQLRELEVLHARADKGSADKGSIDRLHIAHKLAQTLWNYGKQDRAIDLLAAALDECRIHSQGPIDCYAGFLESKSYHARAETFLKERLASSTNQQQKYWLTLRLYRTYESTLHLCGQVSLGSGETLYKAVQKALLDDMQTGDHNHRRQLIDRLLSVYRTVDNKKAANIDEDLRAFAFELLPKILKRQTNNQESIIRHTAETLKDLLGYRDGLAFLIERIENEPSWWRYQYSDGWNQYGWRLGEWRVHVKPLGDLEPRLLAIVTAELRRDLETRQQRNRVMYWQHHGHFWKEKTDDFAKTAEEVLAGRKDSSAAVTYIANYLFDGLDRHDRAIAILLDAHRRKVLDENGQARLVYFLHRRDRHGESIAILLPLVELRPDNIRYRVQLMHAYFRTNQREALLGLLAKTDAYFHKENRWNENAMSELGQSCLANQLFEQSVEYYKELIPLHQRTQPRRGIGNGTLSQYYMNLARAYAGLKNTAEAVDAAGGAIVAWGPRHDRRREAVNALVDVLRGSPDLDAYVAELDKSVAESGMENPIVRKYLGQVYMEQGKFNKAISQLKLAVESQPNDAETHKKLIECYDRKNDKAGAVAQLLRSLQLSRRDIGLYADLGRRYAELEKPKQAERANTSIVEMLPKESESHARLAQIRQEQDRWGEAIEHWRQVAEIRELEPTGLLKMAKAQVHLKQWGEASETLKKLRSRTWPNRFGNVPGEMRGLERAIENEQKR